MPPIGRPDRGREDDRDRDHGECRATLLWLEGVEDNGLLVGLQPAAAKALEQAIDDDLAEGGRGAAQEREDDESCDAEHEVALATDDAADEARNRQDDAVGDEVGGQRPGGVVVACRYRPRDMRQRDVDDRGVENLHERGDGDHDRDQPRVGLRPPGGVGTGRLPGRPGQWRSRSWSGSMRLVVGPAIVRVRDALRHQIDRWVRRRGRAAAAGWGPARCR